MIIIMVCEEQLYQLDRLEEALLVIKYILIEMVSFVQLITKEVKTGKPPQPPPPPPLKKEKKTTKENNIDQKQNKDKKTVDAVFFLVLSTFN